MKRVLRLIDDLDRLKMNQPVIIVEVPVQAETPEFKQAWDETTDYIARLRQEIQENKW